MADDRVRCLSDNPAGLRHVDAELLEEDVKTRPLFDELSTSTGSSPPLADFLTLSGTEEQKSSLATDSTSSSKEKRAEDFRLTLKITSMEAPTELKKEYNAMCTISFWTPFGHWEVGYELKQIEQFHSEVVCQPLFRGLDFPCVPTRKVGAIRTPTEFVAVKSQEFESYLDTVLRRTLLLGSSQVQDFAQFPAAVRRVAQQLSHKLSIPVFQGLLKKEGGKFKAHRQRHFVLLPTLVLQYYESSDAYSIGLSPKGNIDLTVASKMLMYEDESMPHLFGIETPTRTWKIQAESAELRNRWIKALKHLLEFDDSAGLGYIPHYVSEDLEDLAAITTADGSRLMKAAADARERARTTAVTIIAENMRMGAYLSGDDDLGAVTEDTGDSEDIKMSLSDAALVNAAADQITALKKEMQKMQMAGDVEKERLLADQSEKQRDLIRQHQEQVLGFKAQIELIATEMQELEEKRAEREESLQSEMVSLRQEKQELAKKFEEFRALAETTRAKSEAECERLRSKLDIILARPVISGQMHKFKGESFAKMKWRKLTPKTVTFIPAAKMLLWNDVDTHIAKMIPAVKSVSTDDAEVIKNISREYFGLWFLVEGYGRIALFLASSVDEAQAFVNEINRALAL